MKRIECSANGLASPMRGRVRWLCVLGCFGALMLAVGVGLLRTHAQEAFPLPAINPPGAKAMQQPAAGEPAKQPTAAPAGNAQQQEIAQECADLLKMATDLKTDVDKSTKDTLSIDVVRKAGAIEQLARKVTAANGKD